MNALATLIFTWMVSLQPVAPWRATYETTAIAMADVISSEAPLYDGDGDRRRTAATLVALAWFESRYDVRAVGDHGAARGLFQIHGHGDLADPAEATRAALGMIRASFRVCRGRPVEEALGWYAAGGNDCSRGLRESRNRMSLARWLARRDAQM